MPRVRHVCDLPGEAEVLGFCLPSVWVWVGDVSLVARSGQVPLLV